MSLRSTLLLFQQSTNEINRKVNLKTKPTYHNKHSSVANIRLNMLKVMINRQLWHRKKKIESNKAHTPNTPANIFFHPLLPSVLSSTPRQQITRLHTHTHAHPHTHTHPQPPTAPVTFPLRFPVPLLSLSLSLARLVPDEPNRLCPSTRSVATPSGRRSVVRTVSEPRRRPEMMSSWW